MKDRVRESLFDLLGTDVKGALAIDLFAGSGAIGFEAVSRGALRAIFVERHFPTAAILRRSGESLGIQEKIDVRTGDVLLWAKCMPQLPTSSPWIVFISPPWSFFSERWDDLAALIDAMRLAAPAGSTLVVEADTTFDPQVLPNREAWETRSIPPAVLYFHRDSVAESVVGDQE